MATHVFSQALLTLIDFNGERAYLTNTELYTHDATDEIVVEAYLTTNSSDLGEFGVDKLLNFIEIDYIGKVYIDVYYDSVLQFTLTSNTVTSRTSDFLYTPLTKRIAFQKLILKIRTTDANTYLYKAELDFSVLKRRR